METRTGMNSIWALIPLVLVLLAPLPNLPGVVAVNPSAASTSILATPTAGAARAAFDEQQATNDLEEQVVPVYDAASPSIVISPAASTSITGS